MVAARYLVDAAPVTPIRFGLLSAATVAPPRSDGRGADGVDWEPGPCGATSAYGGPCETPTSKTTTAVPGYRSADPFVVYVLESCRAPGQLNKAVARARASLVLGETLGVEDAVGDILAALSGTTNVTPSGGGVTPEVGLSILEQAAAAAYGGQPTIHAARNIVTRWIAANLVQPVGNRLETKLGSLVAAGGGYGGLLGPASAAAASGMAWAWVTGPVVLHRTEVTGPDQPIMAMTDSGSDPGDDEYTNEYMALAERIYSAQIDTCVKSAVQIQKGYS